MDPKQYYKYSKTKLGQVSAISSLGNLQVIRGLAQFRLTKDTNPILEVGSGIGTITKELLENFNNEIFCYELDDFCFRKLLELKKSNFLHSERRLHLTSSLIDYSEINFSAIVIDGPISKSDLIKIVNKSSELKFVAVENYRLLQRVWVTKALYKGKFRQQFVEILHNNRPSTSVFFTNQQTSGGRFHIIFDFILVLLRIYPKLILHTYLSKGHILFMGKNIETKNRRLRSKTPEL